MKINVHIPRIFKSKVFLFLLVSVLAGNIFYSPETLTLRGKLPPGTTLRAATSFYTRSGGPLCRNFSTGSMSFIGYGDTTSRASATANASGDYTLEVPLENKSLFCDWSRKGIYIYASVARQHFTEPRSVDLARMYKADTASAEPVTMQCVKTYYVGFRAEGTPRKEVTILCRNTNAPFPENASKTQYWPSVPVPDAAQEFTLHMILDDGPVYDLIRGPAQYWRDFDAEQSAARQDQDLASTGSGKPAKVTGSFSRLDYLEGTDELRGFQITLIPSETGYYALVELSENWPAKPYFVPAKIEGNKVSFTLPPSKRPEEKFEGIITRQSMQGTFSNSDQHLNLIRQRNYWDSTPPTMRKIGCFSDISATPGEDVGTGHQLFIVYAKDAHYLLYQRLSEQAETPLLLPINFMDNKVEFTIGREGLPSEHFSGHLTNYAIQGKFNGTDELLTFKRQECYWQ